MATKKLSPVQTAFQTSEKTLMVLNGMLKQAMLADVEEAHYEISLEALAGNPGWCDETLKLMRLVEQATNLVMALDKLAHYSE